jgi:glyoxylase-like metal-dependent hydrolase (beta-lactamase superfamily II)
MPVILLSLFLEISITKTTYCQINKSKNFRIEKLSEGIYVAIHTPGGYAICNAGIVYLGEETIIIDTSLSPEVAADLLKVSKELTGNPVKYIINSHYHNDHTRGNQVFKPAAIIISKLFTHNLIEEREGYREKRTDVHVDRIL